MLRRSTALATAAAAAMLVLMAAVPAAAAVPEWANPVPSAAKAWIVVDADTGAVLGAQDPHEDLRPASITKILTALVALRALPPDATVPVGPDAAGMEAMRIGMKPGQVWPFSDVLHSLLIVSANDAAVALADRVGGSRAGFAPYLATALRQLGTQDHPSFQDPAGLDDSFAFGGGNRVSAWDMSVIARAAFSLPAFRSVVSLPQYNFVGPDGANHVLHSQNRLLPLDPTIVGGKPGWTVQAGETLVEEASRGGRTILAVEMDDSPGNMWGGMEGLLQLGFAAPPATEAADVHLPPIQLPTFTAAPTGAPAAGHPTVSRQASSTHATSALATPTGTARPAVAHAGGSSHLLLEMAVVVGVVLALNRGARMNRERRRRRRRTASGGAGPRPGPLRSPRRQALRNRTTASMHR